MLNVLTLFVLKHFIGWIKSFKLVVMT